MLGLQRPDALKPKVLHGSYPPVHIRLVLSHRVRTCVNVCRIQVVYAYICVSGCISMCAYLKLHGGLQGAEVWRRSNPLLQRLQEDPLEVQHLWQTAEQTVHLEEREGDEEEREKGGRVREGRWKDKKKGCDRDLSARALSEQQSDSQSLRTTAVGEAPRDSPHLNLLLFPSPSCSLFSPLSPLTLLCRPSLNAVRGDITFSPRRLDMSYSPLMGV